MNDAGPATAQGIAVTRFSTDPLRPTDRHEAWAMRDWPAIGPLFDTRPLGDLFHNRSDRFALGAMSVHVAEMGAQRYVREARRTRQDGFDQLLIEVMLEGTTSGDANGRETGNLAGGVVFNDLAQANVHESSNSRVILLGVPRALAAEAGLDPHALHGVSIAPRQTALLRAHLLAICGALPELTVAEGAGLARTVLDLVGIALDAGGARAPAASQDARDTALGLAARAAIATRLDSGTLTPDWLCRHLGISRSTLYRLFEASGGVQDHIRVQRLERVRAALAVPGHRPRLADLAERWGFSDAAHLSRLFRAQFGLSPSDYHALHAAPR